MQNSANHSTDPVVPDWSNIQLPETWADKLDLSKPSHLLRFFKIIHQDERKPVEFSEDLMGNELIPKYARQEFHNLPNGNYSHRIANGYIKGFDISMLGLVTPARKKLVSYMQDADSVLDAGCGGGKTAAAALDAGIKDVWGMDPSPYLLQHAAKLHPDVKFVQGIVENTGFPAERFDGITSCFVFHEIPPKYSNMALKEFHRILKPGGIVAIAEPSPIQLEMPTWQLFKAFGFKGLYFKLLARKVHEPFIKAWHKKDYAAWFEEHGFTLLEDNDDCPIRTLVAKKVR